MSEHFTIKLPDDVSVLQGKPRELGISRIKSEIQNLATFAPTSPDAKPVTIGLSDRLDDTGVITIMGTPEQAKAIMSRCTYEVTNLLRVQVPEDRRAKKPEAIAGQFDALGKQIGERIYVHESKGLGEHDTKPERTQVKTYDVASDNSSVILHVDGNVALTRKLLTQSAKLTILGA